jgi:hypothetical protein
MTTTPKPYTECRNYPHRERCSTGVNAYCDTCLLGPDPLAHLDDRDDDQDDEPATKGITAMTTYTYADAKRDQIAADAKIDEYRRTVAAPFLAAAAAAEAADQEREDAMVSAFDADL